jgi:hypothetical protein
MNIGGKNPMGGNDFAKRFNLPYDEKKAFEKFRNRVALMLKKEIGYELEHSNDIRNAYLIVLGAKDYEYWNLIERFIEKIEDLVTLLENLEALLGTLQATNHEGWFKQAFEIIELAITVPPCIPIRMVRTEDEVIFYPKGAPLLDKLLIEDVLGGLSKYPNANIAFNNALKKYELKSEEEYRNLLDDLRVALEQILKSILQNNNQLEKQKRELSKWLEKKNINEQTRINICLLLVQNYTFLQDSEVKHNIGKFKSEEIEYIVYQTGLFLRFLIEIDK